MSGPRVAVVGGGLAGLSAALACADAGAEVTLYEGRSRLGGATFSIPRGDLTLDNGQHVILRCCTEYLRFLRRLGVERRMTLQPALHVPILRPGGGGAELRRSGLPAPFHLAATLLRYRLLRPGERAAAIRAATALRRLDPDDAALDRITFGDWLRAKGQSSRAIAYLWNLIALPTLNLPADEASLALAVRVFRTGLFDATDASDIGVPSVPLQELHGEPAAAALAAAGARIVLSAPVRRIEPAVGGGFGLVLEGDIAQADAVVAAVPHYAAGALLPPGVVDPAALDGLGVSPIVNLHLLYDRKVLDQPFAAAVDSPVQWLFDRTHTAGVTDGQLVAVSLSGARDEIGAQVAELRERFVPALGQLLPRARGAEVLDFAVTREPRATFRGAPETRRLRPGARTSVAGLYLAGAWTDTGWPATMEGAVRSGVAAATAALDDLAIAAGRTPAEGDLEQRVA